MIKPESAEFPTSPDGKASWWAGNVALRFEVYTQAEPDFDIYAEIYKRLALKGHELVVDVGSSDGSFVFWLKEQSNTGQFIGVEPDINAMPSFYNGRSVRFYRGFADKLYGADQSVDVLTSNFMMYFGDEQEANLKEFKRVLKKPSGKFVLSTSGGFNKLRQRGFEAQIGEMKGAVPPSRMNANFDSDIAVETLSANFRNVYHGAYQGKMVFRTEEEVVKYWHSLLSMKDFFDPQLSEEELLEAYSEIVAPIIRREIAELGCFEDFIRRDFFICDDDPYGMWLYDPRQDAMITIRGYQVEQLGIDYSRAD